MVLKSVSCSPDPEVVYVIQMTFFFVTYQKVIFQFQHFFFYTCIAETGGCLGPKQAFLTRKFSWRYVAVWYSCKSNEACRNNLCFGEKMLTWILQLALPNKSIVVIRPKWENNSSTVLKIHVCVSDLLAVVHFEKNWRKQSSAEVAKALLMGFCWVTSPVMGMASCFGSSAQLL